MDGGREGRRGGRRYRGKLLGRGKKGWEEEEGGDKILRREGIFRRLNS